jgi:hypothetical protein
MDRTSLMLHGRDGPRNARTTQCWELERNFMQPESLCGSNNVVLSSVPSFNTATHTLRAPESYLPNISTSQNTLGISSLPQATTLQLRAHEQIQGAIHLLQMQHDAVMSYLSNQQVAQQPQHSTHPPTAHPTGVFLGEHQHQSSNLNNNGHNAITPPSFQVSPNRLAQPRFCQSFSLLSHLPTFWHRKPQADLRSARFQGRTPSAHSSTYHPVR